MIGIVSAETASHVAIAKGCLQPWQCLECQTVSLLLPDITEREAELTIGGHMRRRRLEGTDLPIGIADYPGHIGGMSDER